MTHAHRRPATRRERLTVVSAALLLAGLGTAAGLVVTADDADAAPALPPVRVYDDVGGQMRTTDREPLWPVGQTLADQAAFQRAAVAELGSTVGLALRAGVVLVAVP